MDVFFESLRNAIAHLDRAVEAYAEDPNAEFVRDALISRFSFTFSQTITTLQRYLESVYFVPDARTISPREAIRHAGRLSIIANSEAWLDHVANRNRVSHAYLLSVAVLVAEGAGTFAADAKTLLNSMENGIADAE